jgi:hypothetical protein
MRIYEDFDFRVRLMKAVNACYIDEPLSERRRHESGLSQAKADAHFQTLRRIYQKNRGLLSDLDGRARRRTRRMLLNWIANSAASAGRHALNDSGRSALGRRRSALRCFCFCAAYAPDLLTFGDLYRVFLPARTAERLNDGIEGNAKEDAT